METLLHITCQIISELKHPRYCFPKFVSIWPAPEVIDGIFEVCPFATKFCPLVNKPVALFIVMTDFWHKQTVLSSSATWPKVKLSECYAVPPSVIVSQSPRGFSTLAPLYYSARPSITAMLLRLYLQPQYLQSHLRAPRALPPCRLTRNNSLCPRVTTLLLIPLLAYPLYPFYKRCPAPVCQPQIKTCHLVPVFLPRLLVQDLKDIANNLRT